MYNYLITLYCVVLGSIDSKSKSYFVFPSKGNDFGILEETLYLFFSSILYLVIILLFDYKIFARLYQLVFNTILGTGIGYKNDDEDPDVGGERDKVDAAKSRSCNFNCLNMFSMNYTVCLNYRQ